MKYYAVSRFNAVPIKVLSEKQMEMFLLRIRNTNWDSHEFTLASIDVVKSWTKLQEAVDALWWYKYQHRTEPSCISPVSLSVELTCCRKRTNHSCPLRPFCHPSEERQSFIPLYKLGGKVMASRIILDSPELLEEDLLSLTAACKEFPEKRSRPALERYVRKGVRGIVLETVYFCGKRYTSRQAIERFIRNQLQTEPERAEPKINRKSKKEIDEASKRFGLPEPQKTANE
jgi:hypothetical protein